MRHLRKVGLLCLTVCMLACFAIGAIFTMSYAQPVKSGYGNSQLYKNNDIKFEDRLFDVDYYKENRKDWRITSGPYVQNVWMGGSAGGGSWNLAGCYNYGTWYRDASTNHNHGQSTYEPKMYAYLIDGTYSYGGNTGGVNTITKVFAYVGFPDEQLFPCPEEGYPAMVLVHGGGGTAYAEWVAEWTSRGYVAIAMDTEGKLPVGATGDNYVTTYYGQIDGVSKPSGQLYDEISSGNANLSAEANAILNSTLSNGQTIGNQKFAKQNAWFSDTHYGTDYKEHWFYQATAAVIASNTFIRSFDGTISGEENMKVNSEKIGITGISYGSYLTCLAVGYDGRFECAVPIYGSLNQQIGDKYFSQSVRLAGNSVAGPLWDNPAILSGNPTNTLFLMSNHDYHFDVRSTWSCANMMPNSRVIIRDQYPHSHGWSARYSDTSTSVTANGRTYTVNDYLKDVLDFVDSRLKNDTIKSLPTANAIFKHGENYIYDVGIYNGAVLPTNQAEIDAGTNGYVNLYYVTKDLLINDGNYFNYPTKNPTVYGDYQYGDIVKNGDGTYSYTNPDPNYAYNNPYINVLWTKKVHFAQLQSAGNYRVSFPDNGVYIPSNATYFYIEIETSKGNCLTSEVIKVGDKERVSEYTTRLYDYADFDHSGSIIEFDWSADENGFATASRSDNWINGFGRLEVNADGTVTKTGQILGTTDGTTTTLNGGTMPIYRYHYGVRSSSYSNGVSTIQTDGSGIMNYKAFSVYEDIEFYYNISSENYHYYTGEGDNRVINNNDSNAVIDEAYQVGGHCYFFALFDNIETGLKNANSPWSSGVNAPKLFVASSNCNYEDESGTYRKPLNGRLAFNAVGIFGDDQRYADYKYDETAGGDGTGNNKNQLWFTTKQVFNTDNLKLNGSNWDDAWYKVTIRILEDGAYVFLNGNPIIDPLTEQAYKIDVTREDFEDGFAYLQYANSGNMTIQFKFEETKYISRWGQEFKMTQDANGFSNNRQTTGGYFANGVYATDSNGNPTSDPEIGPEFGSVDSYASGGVSSFVFNDNLVTGTGIIKAGDNIGSTYSATDGSVVRYVPFDVTKDIHFAYNFTPELKFANVNTNTFHYYISLFDSLEDALASGSRGWDPNYNYTTEYGAGVDYNPVISLIGSNMTGYSKDGLSRSQFNGSLALQENYSNLSYFWINDFKADNFDPTPFISERLSWPLYPTYSLENDVSEPSYVQGITEDTWGRHYIDVRIRIGETETTIFLNGTKFCATKEYTRSDFPTGNAYFKFYAFVNSGEVKVNIKVNDELQDVYGTIERYRDIVNYNQFPLDLPLYNSLGEKFEFPMNEYGWNSMSYHGTGKYDGVYDANTDEYFLADQTTSMVGQIDRSDTITTLENGITTVAFSNATDGRSIINYLAFDINQDISFSFRVNDSSASDVDKSCFFFSLFDTLSKAFGSSGNAWDVSGINSGAYAPVMAFESTNGAITNRNYTGKLKVNLASYEFITVNGYVDHTKVSNAAISSINTDGSIKYIYSNAYTLGREDSVEFNNVTIKVLDNYTLVYLNGELFGYYNGMGKAAFPYGKAYLKLTTLADVGSTIFDLQTHGKSVVKEKFDYSQDLASNFANNIVARNVTKTYENAMGETIIAPQFGVAEGTTFGLNSATLKLDNSFTVNYKGFDVTKDIVFTYDVNVPSSVTNNGTSFDVDSLWYSFAFFNDIEMATKFGLDLWLIQQSNFSSGGHAKMVLFGCNDPWGRVPRMEKVVNGVPQVSNYSSSYSTLTYNSYSASTANQTKFGSSEYSEQISHLVKLRILEDCTEFYVDGELMFIDSNVTRADFPWGYAYMSVGTVGQGTFNIEIDRPVELYNYYNGSVYDYATDANGWTTESSTQEEIQRGDYSYVSADPSFKINSTFSRGSADNGEYLNNKGYSIVKLGASSYTEGVENTNDLSLSTYAINTVALDVYKPIRLVYRLESFASAGGNICNASCFSISFAESIEDALKIGTAGYTYAKENTSLDDNSVGNRLNKLMFKTTNTLWENGGWTDELRTDSRYAGRLTSFEGDGNNELFSEFLYDCTLEEYAAKTGDDSAWQKYITLDVNIGETGTVVTIDGKVVNLGDKISSVKRSDFKLGVAYLNVSAHGGVEVAIGVTQSVDYAEGYDYGENTSLLLENGLDFINEFELPVGYYNPNLVYKIMGYSYNVRDFKIDDGTIELISGYVSPHHGSREVTVEYLATIGGEEEVLYTKTFVLKEYLETLYASCGAGETAKKNLIVSLMNLSAAGQKVEPDTLLDTACNANLSEAEKAFATEYDTLKASGAFHPVNGTYNHYAFEKHRYNQTTNLLGFTYLGVGIGSTSTYTIRFIIDSSLDVSKLEINVGFKYKGDVNGVNTFEYSEVATIANGGIKLYSTSTYPGYNEYSVTCYGEYSKDAEGNPIYDANGKLIYSGIKASDFWHCVQFACYYDGTLYGVSQGSVLGYANHIASQTTPAESVAFGKAIQMYYVRLIEYNESLTNV